MKHYTFKIINYKLYNYICYIKERSSINYKNIQQFYKLYINNILMTYYWNNISKLDKVNKVIEFNIFNTLNIAT